MPGQQLNINPSVLLLLWVVELSNTSGVLLGAGGRQLKYLQFKSLRIVSFSCLSEIKKKKSSYTCKTLQKTDEHHQKLTPHHLPIYCVLDHQ